MPTVSVIIPTFNRRDLVARAIDSVLAQTFNDFELIVVDDASTDDTACLPVLRDPPPKVRLVRLDSNRGVSHARNRGVAESSAPLLAFLDSDDAWMPAKLERQVQWLQTHPGVQICQTLEIWVRNGRRVNPPLSHEKSAGWIFERSLDRCMITPSSVVMTRLLFCDAGGFDESLPACEDYDLWLRITPRFEVGLIQEYLLTRNGGRKDQLSASVPVLDRYRITALEKILGTGSLSPDQQSAARRVLVRKAEIVARGCQKRGNMEEHARYAEIARRYADDRCVNR